MVSNWVLILGGWDSQAVNFGSNWASDMPTLCRIVKGCGEVLVGLAVRVGRSAGCYL
jgi:hypothetical protein